MSLPCENATNILTCAEFDRNDVRCYAALGTHGVEVLGDGATGTVFKRTYENRHIAVKVIYEDLRDLSESHEELEGLRREVQVLKNAMGCIRFVGITLLRTKFYERLCILMECAEHGSLHDFMETNQAVLTWPLRKRITFDVASALESLHSFGFYHEDVKSKKVLI